MADDIMTEEELLEINLRQRVRLFEISEDGNHWSERGIGQVTTFFQQKTNETFLLVHDECDESLILESKIQLDTAYQLEQGRFIIWTEDDTVLGLSFQESVGCNDIWEMICQVQGKDPLVENGPMKVENHDVAVGTDDTEVDVMEEDIKEDIKEPSNVIVEESSQNAQEMCFEQMLDIEHVELSVYERDVLEQLIELVNRLVAPTLEDKVPLPAESQLLDIYQMNEGLEETQGLQQVHETILYLLSLSRDRPML